MAKRLTAFLRRAVREWVDGLHAGLDVLVWGHAYPRRVSLQDLQRANHPDRQGGARP